MKAVLVVDMPKCCNECKCNFDHWCSFDNFERHIDDLERKPRWCPLSHPLKRVGHDYYIYDRKYLLDNLDREVEMLKKAKEYESSISD